MHHMYNTIKMHHMYNTFLDITTLYISIYRVVDKAWICDEQQVRTGAQALFVRVVLAAVVVEAAGLVCSASGPPAASVTAAVSVFVGSRRRCCCWRRSPCAPPAARSGSPGAGTPSRSPDSLPSISRALHAKKSLISIRSVTWLETVRQVRHTLLDATYRTQLCHHLG
jgi:hypothetical protein